MKDKSIKLDEGSRHEKHQRPSPLEQIRAHGGRAHRVKGMAGRAVDAMLAVYEDRFTYTFMMQNEVESIHFDRKSQKIYFSGHNIKNLQLTKNQKDELFKVINVLESDPEGSQLKGPYEATLGRQVADNNR